MDNIKGPEENTKTGRFNQGYSRFTCCKTILDLTVKQAFSVMANQRNQDFHCKILLPPHLL